MKKLIKILFNTPINAYISIQLIILLIILCILFFSCKKEKQYLCTMYINQSTIYYTPGFPKDSTYSFLVDNKKDFDKWNGYTAKYDTVIFYSYQILPTNIQVVINKKCNCK